MSERLSSVALTAAQVVKKLARMPHRPAPDLPDAPGMRAFLIGDRILFVDGGGGGQEYDYSAWLDFCRMAVDYKRAVRRGDYKRAVSRDPLWAGIEPTGEAMIGAAKGLAAVLGLEPGVLDRSLSSLTAVDRSLLVHPRTACFEAPVFVPLAAYAGEVLRRNLADGTWAFHRSGWPSVMDRHGNQFALATLYEEVTETQVRTPTQLFVKACLGSIGIPTEQ